jgi:hypothetical protein
MSTRPRKIWGLGKTSAIGPGIYSILETKLLKRDTKLTVCEKKKKEEKRQENKVGAVSREVVEKLSGELDKLTSQLGIENLAKVGNFETENMIPL